MCISPIATAVYFVRAIGGLPFTDQPEEKRFEARPYSVDHKADPQHRNDGEEEYKGQAILDGVQHALCG